MGNWELGEIIYPPEDFGKLIFIGKKVNLGGGASWSEYEIHLLGDNQVFRKESDCFRKLDIKYTRLFELLYG